jgi:hypothetical protein
MKPTGGRWRARAGEMPQIVTAILYLRQMSRLSTAELSTKAKFRLEVFDCYQMNIAQYWTRPHNPKDKAFNERFH